MSTAFNRLQTRIIQIGNDYQTIIDPNPLNQSDDKNQDLIRSYILLCHAEFEYYFEQIANETINNLISSIEKIKIAKSKKNIIKILLINNQKTINTNNGIKIENLEKMYKPLSIDLNSIDPIYKSKLGCFSSKRGEIAHKGIPLLCNSLTFNQEKNEVEWLVQETEKQVDILFDLIV